MHLLLQWQLQCGNYVQQSPGMADPGRAVLVTLVHEWLTIGEAKKMGPRASGRHEGEDCSHRT